MVYYSSRAGRRRWPHTYIHTCICILYIYIYVYTYIHAYIHTHIHTSGRSAGLPVRHSYRPANQRDSDINDSNMNDVIRVVVS